MNMYHTKSISVGDYETIFEIEIKEYHPFTDIVKTTTKLHLSSYELKEAVLNNYSTKKFEEQIEDLKREKRRLEEELIEVKQKLKATRKFPEKSNNKNSRKRK